MNNEFKLRLYKKTGPEKGNLDKELFYQLWQSTTSIGYNPVIPHGRG